MSFIEMEQTISCQQLEIEDLREQVKAQAAVIERLRLLATDELKEVCGLAMNNTVQARIPECADFGSIAQQLSYVIQEAIAIPTDSTQILAEVRKQERERCAKLCETQYPYSVHHTDQRAATNCAAAIRAME